LPIKDAISTYNVVTPDHQLVKTARGIGINLGD